jgi:hypothetical protein
VSLKWDAVNGAEGYRIYRAGEIMDDTKETSATVEIKSGRHMIWVTAYIVSSESGPSDAVMIEVMQ